MDQSKTSRSEAKRRLPREPWKQNDSYKMRMSYGSILTRSQSPFNRVKCTDSDMALFCNGVQHHPSNKPHLLECLVGKNGALPRTIVTRSAANKLELDKNLLDVLKEYKKLAKTDPLIKELKEYQKEHPNLLNPEAKVREVPEGESSVLDEQSATEEGTTGHSSAEESSANESSANESSAEEKSSSDFESSAGETTGSEWSS